MKTGIFFAAKPEAAALLSNGFFGWKKVGNGFYESKKTDSILCISGVGKEKAAQAVSLLAQNCDEIFILGTCAALTPELSVFTFCLPNLGVVSENYRNTFIPDEKLSAKLITALSTLKIDYKTDLKLVTVNNLIATREQAENLRSYTNAVIGDMESAAILEGLGKTQIPAAILRVVSDNPANGISPLDSGNDSQVNKWVENTAKISKLFPDIVKILLSL